MYICYFTTDVKQTYDTHNSIDKNKQ